MRCLLCESWSWSLICKRCQKEFLRPKISRRKLLGDFEVISFYPYSEIKSLLLTKHHAIGAAIYHILARNSFAQFARHFHESLYAIPIDDRIDSGYSHTAILAYHLKSDTIRVRYRTLRARNRITYSGKPLAYRLAHPRDFSYTGPRADIVLVDDIVTTGTTLKEAYAVCKRAGANPLFALTLADAKE